MKFNFFLTSYKQLVIIGCVGIAFGYAAHSFLQKPVERLRVAVIDGERLKSEAVPFAKVKQIIDVEIETVKRDFLPYSNALEQTFDAIKAEKNTAKAQKKKEAFDKKRIETEQIFLKKQEYLQEIQNYFSQLLNDNVLQIITKLAKEKNIEIIHNRFVDDKLLVFYNSNELDVTNEVIHRLEKKLSDIKIPKEILSNGKK